MFWVERTQGSRQFCSFHLCFPRSCFFLTSHVYNILYEDRWGKGLRREETNKHVFGERDVLSAGSCTERLCGDMSMFVLSLHLYVLSNILKGAQKPFTLLLFPSTKKQLNKHLHIYQHLLSQLLIVGPHFYMCASMSDPERDAALNVSLVSSEASHQTVNRILIFIIECLFLYVWII